MLWRDRTRDLVLQGICVAIIFDALEEVWSYPGPPVWVAVGVLVGAGNFRMWQVGGDVGRR